MVFSSTLGCIQCRLDRCDMNVLRCDSPIPVTVSALEAPSFRSIMTIIIMAVPHINLTPSCKMNPSAAIILQVPFFVQTTIYNLLSEVQRLKLDIKWTRIIFEN